MGNFEIDIKDNSPVSEEEFREKYTRLSDMLIDKDLGELSEKNEGFLIFPSSLDSKDISSAFDPLDKEQKIIQTVLPSSPFYKKNEKQISFGNLVGFIGLKATGDNEEGEQLVIHSRFSNGEDDNFLHYMLRQVLNINIVDFDVSPSYDEQLYQLLVYLFPTFLNKALKKGIFKLYTRYEYNDMNIKGTIDIARNIKENIPFLGKVAYSTREFTKDNYLIQLIRHTIEHISSSSKGEKAILALKEETQKNVNYVRLATPSYRMGDRRKVIIANKKTSVRHAYYIEYKALQRLCLMILTHKKHTFGTKNDQIKGIIFDVAWLWEEYLNTLLKKHNFEHPRNRPKIGGLSIIEYTDYEDGKKPPPSPQVYPDFYNNENEEIIIVADAKYKPLDHEKRKYLDDDDIKQMIMYSYTLKAKRAILIHPGTNDIEAENMTKLHKKTGVLMGYETPINRLSVKIPQGKIKFKEFKTEMEKQEEEFDGIIKDIKQDRLEI